MDLPTDPPPHRLTLRYLLREAVHRFFNVEKGWLRTARELFTQPGPMVRRYLRHDRKSYANPLSYLVLGTALSFLAQTAGGVQERLLERLQIGTDQTPGQLELAQEISGMIQQNLLYVSFCILIPFAVLLRLFFRRSGFNLAESFVFAFYAGGHVALLGLALVLLLLVTPMHPQLYAALGTALALAYYSYAAVGFFGGRISTVVKTCLAYFLSFGAFFVLVVVTAAIYVLIFGPSFMRGEAWNLVTAAEKNYVDKARELLDDGTDVDMTLRRTALHVAAENGHTDMVDLLLEHGADVNVRDHLGGVPMFVALERNHSEVAWRLARAGTDATALTLDGASLLLMAVRRGDVGLARWLLGNGADVNAVRKDDRRATALMAAAAAGDAALVELLLEHGADPGLTNGDGQTARDLARDPGVEDLLRRAALP